MRSCCSLEEVRITTGRSLVRSSARIRRSRDNCPPRRAKGFSGFLAGSGAQREPDLGVRTLAGHALHPETSAVLIDDGLCKGEAGARTVFRSVAQRPWSYSAPEDAYG